MREWFAIVHMIDSQARDVKYSTDMQPYIYGEDACLWNAASSSDAALVCFRTYSALGMVSPHTRSMQRVPKCAKPPQANDLQSSRDKISEAHSLLLFGYRFIIQHLFATSP